MKKFLAFIFLLFNSSWVFANPYFDNSLAQAQYLSQKKGNIGIYLFLIESPKEQQIINNLIKNKPHLFIRESVIVLQENKNHQYILSNWNSQCLEKNCVQNPFVGQFYENFLQKNQKIQKHLLIVYNNKEQEGLGWFEHWNQTQSLESFIMRMRQKQIPDHTLSFLIFCFIMLIVTIEVSDYLFNSHGKNEEVKRIPPMF